MRLSTSLRALCSMALLHARTLMAGGARSQSVAASPAPFQCGDRLAPVLRPVLGRIYGPAASGFRDTDLKLAGSVQLQPSGPMTIYNLVDQAHSLRIVRRPWEGSEPRGPKGLALAL